MAPHRVARHRAPADDVEPFRATSPREIASAATAQSFSATDAPRWRRYISRAHSKHGAGRAKKLVAKLLCKSPDVAFQLFLAGVEL